MVVPGKIWRYRGVYSHSEFNKKSKNSKKEKNKILKVKGHIL
jgi:hypothetical protein